MDPDLVDPTSPPALQAALRLCDQGFWVVATVDKRPRGKAWGATRKTEAELRETWRPDAGPGICLGPDRAPDGGWLIDLEGDGPQAEESLAMLLGWKIPPTMSWTSARGEHHTFVANGDRLLKLLAAAGAVEGKGHESGKFTLPDVLPGLEFRIGGRKPDGSVKQFQSVCPPTPGSDGRPREWNGVQTIAELPEVAYETLKEIAEAFGGKREERAAIQEADHGGCADLPPTGTPLSVGNGVASGGNGVVKHEPARPSPEERAAEYLETVEPAISYQDGHNTAFRVACIPVRLGITDPDTVYRLLLPWNERCLPPWSAADLRHKAEEACKLEKRRDLIDKGTYNNISQQADRKTAMYSTSNVITHNGHVNRLYQPNGDGQVSEEVDTRPEVIDQGRAAEADILAEIVDTRPEIVISTQEHEVAVAVEAPDDPFRLARIYIKQHQHTDGLTLRSYRGEWLRWVDSAWRPVTADGINAALAASCKAEFDRLNGQPIKGQNPRKVSRNVVGDVKMALTSLTILDERVESPSWLDTAPADQPFPAAEVLPVKNALIHLPTLTKGDPSSAILEPTPRFFTPYALDYEFNPQAPEPTEWLKFLRSLWADDQESIDTLQEWFGYCLTPDTRQQKILSLIGPKRSGKGTIARVLRALVGVENTAGPTLSGLTGNFGLEPLIGKPLAIISDARLSGRADQAIIVEALLSISGEDPKTVHRKHKTAWEGILPTRFVLISNELPRLHDTSGALPSRLIILSLTQTFYGKEDKTLYNRLLLELPGILLWAIEGWRRLQDRGFFNQPKSGGELVAEMEDLASPVGAFLRDRCDVGPGLEVGTHELFAAWKSWCDQAGRKEPGDQANLGRNLRAVLPALITKLTRRKDRATGHEVQTRLYTGVGLKSRSEAYHVGVQ